MSALKARVSESQSLYRLAKLHYVNQGASQASDLDDDNALV
jgi:hypothetical protein